MRLKKPNIGKKLKHKNSFNKKISEEKAFGNWEKYWKVFFPDCQIFLKLQQSIKAQKYESSRKFNRKII